MEKGQIGVGQEERIAAAGPGVLHRGAVAQGDLAVVEDQEHGDRLAGGADAGEAGCDRGAGIIEAVVAAPCLIDRWLSKKKADVPLANKARWIFMLYLGLPTSRPRLMA